MRWLFRIIFLLVVVVGGGYFIGTIQVGDSATQTAKTAVERQIRSSEDQLTRMQRVRRLFAFPEAVTHALNERVPADERVSSDEISPYMKEALIATEDKRFYEHGPVDMIGIGRAIYTNMTAGETLQGGSTITQQLVKNLFLSSKRIMSRKVEEVLLSYLMEHYYTKDEILTMYLNSIYYGNGYYGIAEASEGYFGCTPKELTLAQAALLAGLPQAPSHYNPYKNFEEAKRRQRIVLSLMAQQGVISYADSEEAYQDSFHLMHDTQMAVESESEE